VTGAFEQLDELVHAGEPWIERAPGGGRSVRVVGLHGPDSTHVCRDVLGGLQDHVHVVEQDQVTVLPHDLDDQGTRRIDESAAPGLEVDPDNAVEANLADLADHGPAQVLGRENTKRELGRPTPDGGASEMDARVLRLGRRDEPTGPVGGLDLKRNLQPPGLAHVDNAPAGQGLRELGHTTGCDGGVEHHGSPPIIRREPAAPRERLTPQGACAKMACL